MTITITLDGNEAALTGTTKGDETQRDAIRRPWVWSRRQAAYVLPRSLRPETRAYHVRAVTAALEAAGHPVTVEDSGARLTVAEERAQAAERLEARADRYEAGSERLADEADARWKAERAILDPIPFGQPILVGHHSEGRHRRALARADSHARKGLEALRGSERLAGLAEGLRRDLAGTPLVTLRRRIDRNEAEVRRLTRRIDGTDPSQGYGKPATGGYLERLTGMRDRAQEALDLDRAEVARRAEEDGVRVWTREDFRKGDEVMDRYGEWTPVLRVNAKTVTTPHGIAPLAAAGHTWTRSYAEIQGRRRDGEVTR